MINTSSTSLQKCEAASSRYNGIANLFVGLVIGGGAVAYIEEGRLDDAKRQNDALVEKVTPILKEAYPVVTAAALDANLPPPPGAFFAQGIPDEYRDLRTAARDHSEGFGKAVEAFRSEIQKR